MNKLQVLFSNNNPHVPLICKILSKHGIFSALDLVFIQKLAKIFVIKQFTTHQTILKQNSKTSDLFLILEGKVEIYDPQTRQITCQLEEEMYFGNLAPFFHFQRKEEYRSGGNGCLIAFVEKNQLDNFIRQQIGLSQIIKAIYMERVQVYVSTETLPDSFMKKHEQLIQGIKSKLWNEFEKIELYQHQVYPLDEGSDLVFIANGLVQLQCSNETDYQILSFIDQGNYIHEINRYVKIYSNYVFLQLFCLSGSALVCTIRKAILSDIFDDFRLMLSGMSQKQTTEMLQEKLISEFLAVQHSVEKKKITVVEKTFEIQTQMIQLLKTNSIFSKNEKLLEFLFSKGKLRKFPADAVIFKKGDYGSSFFIILEGEVKILFDQSPIRLKAGDYFGEITLLLGVTRLASCQNSSKDLLVLEIMQETLKEICIFWPQFEKQLKKKTEETFYQFKYIEETQTIHPTANKDLIMKKLKKILFFKDFDEPLLKELSDGAQFISCQKGIQILKENESSLSLFWILDGKIAMKYNESVLKILKSPEFFGDIRDKANQPRNYSFWSVSKCEMILFSEESIRLLEEKKKEKMDNLYDTLYVLNAKKIPPNSITKIEGKSSDKSILFETGNYQTISELPEQFWANVYEFLPLHEMLKCRLVCHHWSKIVRRQLKINTISFHPKHFSLEKFYFRIKLSGQQVTYCDLSKAPINITHFKFLIKNCPNIEYLNVYNTKGRLLLLDKETLPLIFKNLLKLSELILPRGMPIRKGFPQSKIKKLLKLSSDHSDWNYSDIETLCEFNPFIEELSLTKSTTLDDDCIKYLTNHLRFLTKLNLSDNMFLTDQSLRQIALLCPNLRHLDISTCGLITDCGLYELSCGPQQYESLNLSNCHQLTDASLIFFSDGIQNLESLKLRYCSLMTNDLVKYLIFSCPKLKLLDLTNCLKMSYYLVKQLISSFPSLTLIMNEPPNSNRELPKAENIPVSDRYLVIGKKETYRMIDYREE